MSEDALGVQIPDEHVGPFVAEVFEDVERDTDWETVVDALVAPEARETWEQLEPREQAAAVLRKAADYDQRAIDCLESIRTDGSADAGTVEEQFGEARRCRRNADTFRDSIASAYSEGHLDAEALVGAIEDVGFDTSRIADREDELERVANHFDLDFQPYGGTLIEEEEGFGEEQTAPETW